MKKRTFLMDRNPILKTTLWLIRILLLFFLCLFLEHFFLFSFFLSLLKALIPFFLGLFLALLLEPLVRKFEKKCSKLVACILPFLFFFVFFLLVFLFLLPPLFKELNYLMRHGDEILSDLKALLEKIWPFTAFPSMKQEMILMLETLPRQIETYGKEILPKICASCLECLTGFFFAILTAFYVLFDFSKMKDWMKKHFPNIYKEEVKEMLASLRTSMSRYLLGVFFVLLLVFLTQLIGLSIAGLKSPLAFASLCAITDLIPYIGPYLGGIPCILIGFSMGTSIGIKTLISILVVQFLENCFYQPYILGKTLVLPPWLILLFLLVAGHFFGILGMIFSTPVLAILKILFPFCVSCFKRKKIATCGNF